jgi:hypothetical protein
MIQQKNNRKLHNTVRFRLKGVWEKDRDGVKLATYRKIFIQLNMLIFFNALIDVLS